MVGGGGLGFCEGVKFSVNFINLQFEGGLDAGWRSQATGQVPEFGSCQG